MRQYSKVLIVLKDDPKHDEYNKRIIDYLNDRHTIINNNMFTIAIDVADDTNINDYVRDGMESIPAMRTNTNEPYIYGVNSIMAALSKLEISQIQQPAAQISNQDFAQKVEEQSKSLYHQMLLEEMKSGEPDDPNSPSTIKPPQQELPEAPLTDKMIEEKAKAYDKIFQERNSRNQNNASMKAMRKTKDTFNSGLDRSKYLEGLGKGEELLMRQIAESL